MIDAAFLSLLFVALLCKNGSALFFVLACILHDAFFGSFDGFGYYGTAAIFGYLSLFFIDRSSNIQFICLSSICLNLFGYMLWYFEFMPTLYNYSFLSLYIITAIVCAGEDGGNNGVSSGFFGGGLSVYPDDYSRGFFRNQSEIKS